MSIKQLWFEKYRPKTLDGYVFQNDQQKKQILNIIKSGDLPHLLLSGIQGSGKTTLSEILINELKIDEADIMRINASDKTGIDYIRDTILGFAGTYPIGKFKVVKLEESDYLSQAGQGMLRAVLEENADTCRFIFTCNNDNKIIQPIKSRVQHLHFIAPKEDDVLMRMLEILASENINVDDIEVDENGKLKSAIVQKYVSQAFPDIRKIINNMQLNTANGKLGNPIIDADGGDYLFKLLDLIIAGNLREIRKLVTEQCTSEQLTEVFEFLYKNIGKHPKYTADLNAYESALCILLDGVYKHGLVAIPHLNFEATMIKLNNAIGD
jgi:replication factor C subunit 2/4